MVVSGLAIMVALAQAPAIDTAAPEARAAEAHAIETQSPATQAARVLFAQAEMAGAAAPASDPDVPDDDAPEQAEGTPDAALPEEEPDADGGVTEGEAIVVTGELGAPEGDPAEQLNVATYQAVQAVDEAVVEPIAKVYDESLPRPLRDGLRNFLRNLGEPVNFLHYMLQLKPGKAFKVAGRFFINTTIGIGGLFDHASKEPFNLKYEPNGLANTLGYYGVGPGPYLYLPFIGSTTVRDIVGRVADLSVLPAVVGPPLNDPYYALPVGALTSLESRIAIDAQIDAIRDKCGDPYAANRDLYLIQRQVEIDRLRGKVRADLGEIQDRLEFNCDIEIETGYIPKDQDGDFVQSRTTLLNKAEEPVPAEDVLPADPETAPAQEVEQPALEPSGEPIMGPEGTEAGAAYEAEPVG